MTITWKRIEGERDRRYARFTLIERADLYRDAIERSIHRGDSASELALRERMKIRIEVLALVYRKIIWRSGKLPSSLCVEDKYKNAW